MQAYHFFSPLLAPNQAWAAFDWQCFSAAAAELATVAGATDACVPLTRQHPLMLSCSPAWLSNSAFREFIKKLGRDQAILAFPSGTAEIKEQELACKALRQDGAHVALGITESANFQLATLTSFDYLRLDSEHARSNIPLLDLINAHQSGFQLVASGVHSHELFDWAVAKRFSLMSSEFVTKADDRAPVDADTTRLKLLKLLSLVVQDADTREIEEIFRQEPKLSYNLLRLVNSVAVGPKTPITGFNQAITVLGRRQLQRWLQLLIYANQFGRGNQPNPLMQLAAARGRQLELLTAGLPSLTDIADTGEAAFMVGIFSLLDTLLHMPMSEILSSLPLSPTITSALRDRSGLLGELLTAVIASNTGDFRTAAESLKRSGIPPEKHLDAQIGAYSWASRISLE
ncbi:MAG: HDOD domain-containing protein [Betaproteobacteria bacterium]|nr:HDOD domain-containing protein [Betaproteobacteria bacterium]